MTITFGSVCSGIEAASMAWHRLGWKASWLSEIEPFPSALLAHHYPTVPNLGNMLTLPKRILAREVGAPDIFCGGTPCQSFSVAGGRDSLDDARGNLTQTFVEILNAIDTIHAQDNRPPAVAFYENVPGILNTKDNAFGCLLAGLTGETVPLDPPRGRWTNSGIVFGPHRQVAWRVLDAQWFGLAQRRKRVFIIASAREGFSPAEVLFEYGSQATHTPPQREAWQNAPAGLNGSAWWDGAIVEPYSTIADVTPKVTHEIAGTLRADGGGGIVPSSVAYGIQGNMIGRSDTAGPQGIGVTEDISYTLTSADIHGVVAPHVVKVRGGCEGSGKGYLGQDEQVFTISCNPDQYVALAQNQLGEIRTSTDVFNTLNTNANARGRNTAMVATQYAVRRLTPIECERLMGFPDNYTLVPWGKDMAGDGVRYKALGNSWAVPVVAWLGHRINEALK